MNRTPLHLLIVEDEAAHVEAIRRAFDQAGFKTDIQAVGTLREYRERIAAQPPDLALVDLNLPDGRATEVLTHPAVDAPFPILVMTAFGNQQIVVEVMKAGALDYVVKSPEAFSALPRTVTRALREWQLLRNHKQGAQALIENAQRLRELSHRLLETEESERRKINRELHDSVGQNLSALNLNLAIIGSGLPEGTKQELTERFEDARKLLETTVRHVRDVMADLHPPALDDYGLLAALRSHAASFATRGGLTVTVRGKDLEPRPPLSTELALFRIAQEALANADKHAQARRVKFTLAAGTHSLRLGIADDGVGFDPQAAGASGAHWGMATMRERAEAIGAALSVESTPGRGTCVTVQIARAPA